MSHWTVNDIPDQTGRRVLITGANSGIGYYTALELARKGAHVILACRSEQRGRTALHRLRTAIPAAQAELLVLDLANFTEIRKVGKVLLEDGQALDLLINNAGVMAPPLRLETVDGFELQFGTNVLGHFLLTSLLFPLLQKAAAGLPAPRIVTVASIAHKRGRIDFEDLQATRSYAPMRSYQQSKLANLMLALELDRRLRAAMSPILSTAAHPGVANTNLFHRADYSAVQRASRALLGKLFDLFLNSEPSGALPTLYAATSREAVSGGYYGPQGFQEMRGGDVGRAVIEPHARDEEAAARLWAVCEELTGATLLP